MGTRRADITALTSTINDNLGQVLDLARTGRLEAEFRGGRIDRVYVLDEAGDRTGETVRTGLVVGNMDRFSVHQHGRTVLLDARDMGFGQRRAA